MATAIWTVILGILIILFILVLRRIMRRDNYINTLILAFYERGEIERTDLVRKMYDYGTADFMLKRVIAKYNLSYEDYLAMFNKIMSYGNIKKRRRYLPINSFFYVSSLEKLVKFRELSDRDYTMKMMNHFHF